MQIPADFIEKAIRTFGQPGRAWTEALPVLLQHAIARWELTDLRLVEPLSVNLVCFARSSIHGDVVLKLGVPQTEVATEMRALALWNGQGACRLHAADPDRGIMLLERIRPGTDLTRIPTTRERSEIAARLMQRLHQPAPADHGLPLYSEKLAAAFTRARRERWGCLDLVAEAEARQAPDLQPPVLLHGDLHHWNILQGEDGEWKAIDPHGAVGPAAVGPARFIQNEFSLVHEPAWPAMLATALTSFAAGLGIPVGRLATALFIDMVLSLCWSYEDSASPEQIAFSTRRARAILAHCQAE